MLLAGGGLAVDTSGSVPRLYIADTWNNRVLGYCDARKAKQGDKADLVVGQAGPAAFRRQWRWRLDA